MKEKEPISIESVNSLIQKKQERELEGSKERVRFWFEGTSGKDTLTLVGTTQRIDIHLKGYEEEGPPEDHGWVGSLIGVLEVLKNWHL